MKKKSYFIKAMFSYIVMVAILGMVIIMGNTASAQITWPDAEVFNIPSSGFNGITANSFTTYGSKTGGDIFIITEGSSSLLHNSAMSVSNCVGGIGSKLEGIYYRIRHASDLSIIYEEINSTIAIPIAIKGDTLVYNSSFGSFLKIGSSDPVELVGVTGDIKGYVISNNHIYVYEFLSATQTNLYDFDVDNLEPQTPQILNERVYSISFLDSIQVKKSKVGSNSKFYLFTPSNSWQQIDENIVVGIDYHEVALSYYEDNKLCVTFLNTYNGNLLQIYTAGFPSEENDILSFSFPEQTASAVINSTNKTVDIQVANGTILTNLVASFTLSAGATAYIGGTLQQSGVTVNDFTNPVTYTVTAEDGTAQVWTVTVTEAPFLSPENDITAFSFANQVGTAVIDATAHTVTTEIAYGHASELTALVPTIEVSANATINPLSGVARDFTNPVTYTVTAENGETQDWTVNVSIETSVPTTDNSQLLIYPNPTSGWLKIETTEIIEKVTISDLSGRIMLTTDQSEIDLSQIANGSYLISIETHETVYTNKILITR